MITTSATGIRWAELTAPLHAYVRPRVRTAADAEDVVQDILLRIHAGLPALRDDDRFGPWVFSIARRAVTDYVRRASRAPVAVSGDSDVLAAAETVHGAQTLEQDATHAQVAQIAAWFVTMLPSPYRETLTLTDLQGLSQKAAADALGITLSALKSRVVRGRALLRQSIEECCAIALDARGRVIDCAPRSDGKLPEACCD